MDTPKPNDIYRHFKGELYKIITLAEHTETGESMVVYQALYGDFKVYVRPLVMFMQILDRVKYPDAEQVYRFEPVSAMVGQASGGTAALNAPEAQEESAERPRETEDGETPVLDPLVLEFLDADTYEERLNILAALQHRITDDMIDTMAVAVDVEIEDGEITERCAALKSCLLTLEKYECNRIR